MINTWFISFKIIKFLDKRKKMIKYANFYTQLRNKFSLFHIYKKNEIFKWSILN